MKESVSIATQPLCISCTSKSEARTPARAAQIENTTGMGTALQVENALYLPGYDIKGIDCSFYPGQISCYKQENN